MKISVVDVTSSTNTVVRDKANFGMAEGYMVIANEQTAGRERLSRSFFLPKTQV